MKEHIMVIDLKNYVVLTQSIANSVVKCIIIHTKSSLRRKLRFRAKNVYFAFYFITFISYFLNNCTLKINFSIIRAIRSNYSGHKNNTMFIDQFVIHIIIISEYRRVRIKTYVTLHKYSFSYIHYAHRIRL